VVPVFCKGAVLEMRAERLSLEACGVEADFNEGEAKVQDCGKLLEPRLIVDGSGVPYHDTVAFFIEPNVEVNSIGRGCRGRKGQRKSYITNLRITSG
jgi:hypothetical protein